MRHAKTHDIIEVKCKVGRSSRIRSMGRVPHGAIGQSIVIRLLIRLLIKEIKFEIQ